MCLKVRMSLIHLTLCLLVYLDGMPDQYGMARPTGAVDGYGYQQQMQPQQQAFTMPTTDVYVCEKL